MRLGAFREAGKGDSPANRDIMPRSADTGECLEAARAIGDTGRYVARVDISIDALRR